MPSDRMNETDGESGVDTCGCRGIFSFGVDVITTDTPDDQQISFDYNTPLEHLASVRRLPIVEDVSHVDPEIIHAMQFWFGNQARVEQKMAE